MCFIPLCFPSFVTVYTKNGPKQVSELAVGEEVKVMQHDTTVGWSPMIGWAHNDPKQDATFVEIWTAGRKAITLSPDHLMPVVRNGGSSRPRWHEGPEFVRAADLVEGDNILLVAGSGAEEHFQLTPVTGRCSMQSVGIFAPLTMAGTVVVENTAASCYASVPSHSAAHAALAPIRAAYELRGVKAVSGKHHAEKDGKMFTGALNYVDKLGRMKYRAESMLA